MAGFVNRDIPALRLLSDRQYERFQTLVLKRTGILFGVKRRNALGRGVNLLCEKWAENDLERYYQMLQETETDSPIWDDLIEELTVGETYFFRDENQVKALREHLLPRIIEAHQYDRRIRIWSAGCASGEEPYTVSMLLMELIPDMDPWNIFILGTDINKQVLKKARRARYRSWSFRQTDPLMKDRYFRYLGEEYEALPKVQRNVRFEYLNLMEPTYPSLFTNTNAMDLILCRNVAIYYSEDVVREVVSRFYKCLLPEGWLMMGAAETSIPAFDQYAYHMFAGGTVYQKTDEPKKVPRYFEIDPFKESAPLSVTAKPVTPINVSDFPLLEEESSKRDERLEIVVEEPVEPENVHDLGKALFLSKKYEEARELFLKAIAENPSDTESLYYLGRVHANIGQMEAARSYCEQAVEISPLKAEAYYTLALIHQESGDNRSAFECLKRTLFLEPAFALAHVSMAILCKQMNQKEKSERHRRQAIDLASAMEPETVLQGAEDLTAKTLLTMARTIN